MASELDWQDARFASLEKATDAMLEVWDEADRMKEAVEEGETVDTAGFDRAAAEAEGAAFTWSIKRSSRNDSST